MDSKINIDLLIKYIKKISSEGERRMVDDWLNQSEENRNNYKSFLFYWDSAGVINSRLALDIELGWEKISNRTLNKKNGFLLKQKNFTIAKIAASIIFLLGIASIIYMQSSPFVLIGNKVTYQTNQAIQRIVLEDSSVVWLNKNSSLTTPSEFNGEIRQVILEGEAYFEIKRNPKKPFLVKTIKTITEVLGTSFNIKSDQVQNTVNINVVSGKVAFYKQSEKNKMAILKQGDAAFYNPIEESVEKLVNTNKNYLSWKTRKLEFNESSLKQVCQDLNNCYNGSIVIDKLPDEKLNFTGSFDNASLNEVLYIIELTLDLKFLDAPEGTIVHLNDTIPQ